MYQTILVPLDGSELSLCVLPHLQILAEGGKVGRVILLRVIEPIPSNVAADYVISEETAEKLIADHTRQAGEWLKGAAETVAGMGVRVDTEVVAGRTAEAITEYATRHGVELVLMATHGRSGAGRWLMGSVAERVLRTSCAPILLIRPPSCRPPP